MQYSVRPVLVVYPMHCRNSLLVGYKKMLKETENLYDGKSYRWLVKKILACYFVFLAGAANMNVMSQR